MITNRRIGGRRAQRSGKNFQNAIRLSANGNSPLELEELPNCGGFFVGAGKFVRQNMPCDVIGTFRGAGRSFYADAKSCDEHAAGLRVHDPEIMKPHQIAFLQCMQKAGAVAGVLVECKRRGEYLWLSAEHLREGKTIPWSDTRWVPLGVTTSLVDFSKLPMAD